MTWGSAAESNAKAQREDWPQPVEAADGTRSVSSGEAASPASAASSCGPLAAAGIDAASGASGAVAGRARQQKPPIEPELGARRRSVRALAATSGPGVKAGFARDSGASCAASGARSSEERGR